MGIDYSLVVYIDDPSFFPTRAQVEGILQILVDNKACTKIDLNLAQRMDKMDWDPTPAHEDPKDLHEIFRIFTRS